MKEKKSRTNIVFVLIISLFASVVGQSASADVVTTEQLLQQMQIQEARNNISMTLATDEFRSKLESMGVKAEDVDSRIAALTDAEIMQLSAEMDELPAGGVFGAIIAILVIFILLDVAGATDIFPGV